MRAPDSLDLAVHIARHRAPREAPRAARLSAVVAPVALLRAFTHVVAAVVGRTRAPILPPIDGSDIPRRERRKHAHGHRKGQCSHKESPNDMHCVIAASHGWLEDYQCRASDASKGMLCGTHRTISSNGFPTSPAHWS